MSKVRPQTRKPIKDNSIIKCIEETIKALGYPFLFRYDHGLTMIAPIDDFKVAEYGNLNFYYGISIPISLSKGYISLEAVVKPDNLIKDLKAAS
ncbi:hypothetical protein [Desulfosporosinus sp. I2]|uniref:hypothetical protein n=1 Tax=Desulfosporosinus sp. I2 TaxID=1617025 RepID=UPI0005EE7049|nr:hypothetical protein [Desulfosporosinus sp. I2]